MKATTRISYSKSIYSLYLYKHLFNRRVFFYAVESRTCPFGPGYTLQVLAARSSRLWAFRCYPSRARQYFLIHLFNSFASGTQRQAALVRQSGNGLAVFFTCF
jgi:hypothetical protein